MSPERTRAHAVAAILYACLPMTHPAPAGADAAVTISTDRPSVADYSPVVPLGALQIESGLVATDTDSLTTLDAPEVLLRYGLLAKTELRLTLPDYFWNYAHYCRNPVPSVSAFSHTIGACSGPNGTTSGFGDVALRLKQHLGKLGGFDLLIIPTLSFPTGARQFSSGGYDPGLMLPWSRSLSANWTAAGQFAAYWPTVDGSRNYTSEATLLFDRQLTAPWDAFIEYVGAFRNEVGRGNCCTWELLMNSRRISSSTSTRRPGCPRQHQSSMSALGIATSFSCTEFAKQAARHE